MARRRPRPYVNLRAGGNDLPTMANFAAPGGPRITTFDAKGRPVRETVTGNELDVLPQVRGLRIRRNVRTNYGVRDLVVDQQGNVLTAIRGGSNPRLMMSTPQAGQPRRLVVGRGSATTGGGAAPTTPGADTPAVPAGPPDPYADYNDYPFIKNYLSGLDRQYDSFQNYVTNTYNPAVTAASQALTQLRLNSGNAYNSAVQNYAGSAGQVASAITTPQVAGMTGGTVQAPNQNALGAAQSMAATRNVARSLDAGYRTALGGLEAEKMGQSFLSSTMGYAAGLLNQYGQKRQAERLKMDQWIAEQKAAEKEAKDKQELELMKMDARMINALIASGDRAAARDVTTRGQDIQANNAAADDARAGQITPQSLLSGYRKVPKGAGANWRNKPGAVQDMNGDWWIPKPGGSSGGGGGSTKPKVINKESIDKVFRSGFVGKPPETYPGGAEKPNTGTEPTWKGNRAAKRRAAAAWVISNRKNFVGLTKADATVLRTWLAGFDFLTQQDVNSIISQVKQQL